MKTLLVVLTFIFIGINGNVLEIWRPEVISEILTNKTKVVGDFLMSETNAIKDRVDNFVEESKKKTGDFSRSVQNFIENQTERVDNTINEYMGKVKNVSADLMDSMNVFKPAEDCKFEPEVYLNTPQIIARNGYAVESHTVITEDGYLLTLHRIPHGKGSRGVNRQPVLLHHGLLASSADWIIAGPQKALAYILADAGYDVWLANVRGNTYSRAHVDKPTTEAAFWNFTWHEIGYYDLPAAIDYINDLKKTTGEIIYIGHSMGTTVLFVLLSTRPEYNTKIRAGFALAPVAFMSAIKSPIRLLAPYANDIEVIAKFLGANEFLPQNIILKWLSRYGCEINHYEEKICENSLFILCGYDDKQFNRSLIPVILSHTPAGASTKSLVHYAQEIQAKGKFQYFDYGTEGNLMQYGSKTPPQYPLHKITLPIGLLSGNNDWLSGGPDVLNLYKQLANPIEHFEIPMKEFNHLDFLWGIDAPTLVYNKLLEMMGKYKIGTETFWSFNPYKLHVSWSSDYNKK